MSSPCRILHLPMGQGQRQEAKSCCPRGTGWWDRELQGALTTLAGLAVVRQIACRLGPFDLLTFLWGHLCLGKWFC